MITAPPPEDRPAPRRLAPLSDGRNPIQALLGEIGLPWREPRAVVEARFGIGRHPVHDWDVVNFNGVGPIVPDLLFPLTAQVSHRFPPHLPITEFSGLAGCEADAVATIHRVAASLAARFGPAPIGRRTYYTLNGEWRCGAAAIELTVRPPEFKAPWESALPPRPPDVREPRLRTACSIEIRSGFRLPLTAREREWLDGFRPLAELPLRRISDGFPEVAIADVAETAPSQYYLEYAREPPGDLTPFFARRGLSPDGKALIFCNEQLFVIPIDDVLGIKVVRVLPAKGCGRSEIEVECRTACPGVASKTVGLACARGPDDLNDTARVIAAALDKPLVIGEYDYDV